MTIRIRPFILMSLFILSQCSENGTPYGEYDSGEGVFICNEGNFTYGNSSLSFYDPVTKEVSNQVFFNANGFPPGDVMQSMVIRDQTGFVVINNSGKILVINVDDFRVLSTVNGLTSPRYICMVSATKAYVSDLYSPFITIMDPGSFQVTGHIKTGRGTEHMVKSGNFAYACNWSYGDKVYKIDCRQDLLTDSLTVALQPNSMAKDIHEKLWVLSDGGYPGIPGGQQKPALTCIDLVSFTIDRVFVFPDEEFSPTRLTLNESKDTLFYLNGGWGGNSGTEPGVYRMAVTAENIPGKPFIPEKTRLFYGLGVDPVTSEVYVSDAVDYISPGWIYRHAPTGMLIDSFQTDIAPSAFCFKP